MDFVVTPATASYERPRVPCTLVIFGVAGDLARRKLLPSVFRLWTQKHLHEQTAIVGVARREWSDDAFRNEVANTLEEFVGSGVSKSDSWQTFSKRLFFVNLDLENVEGYRRLYERRSDFSASPEVQNQVVYYLSTPPDVIGTVVERMGAAGLAARYDGGWPRIVVEKPFGRDLNSAVTLNSLLQRTYPEEQIYRIDHYLGKESVQNLFVFRFGNTIYESIWNRRYVDHVQVTVAETLGVERRGPFYEATGALRDIVQNHVIQLLATVCMEPPSSFDARHVRNEKMKVVEAIRRIPEERVADEYVRAQYTAGTLGGERAPGYRDEERVAPNSVTETFVAAKLLVDTWRWSGVPFYIRTGKRLPKRVTEVAIHFKEPPLALFQNGEERRSQNVLALRIQPNEGIALSFAAKTPGVSMHVASVEMDFRYGDAFRSELPDAYETLLLDVIQGDAMLFAPAEMHEAAWRILTPVLNAWEDTLAPLYRYPAGTWGPKASDDLIERDGRAWRTY
jgi:glucose-6-phosphate 1-dehydrogenase